MESTASWLTKLLAQFPESDVDDDENCQICLVEDGLCQEAAGHIVEDVAWAADATEEDVAQWILLNNVTVGGWLISDLTDQYKESLGGEMSNETQLPDLHWQPVLDTTGSILDDDLPLHYLVREDGNMVYQGNGVWWVMPKGYAICRSTKGEQQPASLMSVLRGDIAARTSKTFTAEQIDALHLIIGGEWDTDNRWWGIADEDDKKALALLREMLREIKEQSR